MPRLVALLDTGREGMVVKDHGDVWLVFVSDCDRYEYWLKDFCIVLD